MALALAAVGSVVLSYCLFFAARNAWHRMAARNRWNSASARERRRLIRAVARGREATEVARRKRARIEAAQEALAERAEVVRQLDAAVLYLDDFPNRVADALRRPSLSYQEPDMPITSVAYAVGLKLPNPSDCEAAPFEGEEPLDGFARRMTSFDAVIREREDRERVNRHGRYRSYVHWGRLVRPLLLAAREHAAYERDLADAFFRHVNRGG